MRLKSSGQRVCAFGVTQQAIEASGVGWMLDGWLEDGPDDNQERLITLLGLMQVGRRGTLSCCPSV